MVNTAMPAGLEDTIGAAVAASSSSSSSNNNNDNRNEARFFLTHLGREHKPHLLALAQPPQPPRAVLPVAPVVRRHAKPVAVLRGLHRGEDRQREARPCRRRVAHGTEDDTIDVDDTAENDEFVWLHTRMYVLSVF